MPVTKQTAAHEGYRNVSVFFFCLRTPVGHSGGPYGTWHGRMPTAEEVDAYTLVVPGGTRPKSSTFLTPRLDL